MAFEGYITWDAETDGANKGESPREAHADKCAILAFEYGIKSPKDVKTGASAGRRQHNNFAIIKELGANTPILFNICATNQNVKTVTVELFRTNTAGEEEKYMTFLMTNAQIAGIDYSTGFLGEGSARGGGEKDIMECEKVQFTFQRIEITADVDGTSAIDDWNL